MTSDRVEIYQQISDERRRQDQQWGGACHDDKHNTLEWVLYIDYQTEKLELASYDLEGDERLVKIAALAVAALESRRRKRNAARHVSPCS
jgi:hypothetical protein